jgi:hypothetical protein
MKIEFPRQISEKSQCRNFIEISSNGIYAVHRGKTEIETDGHAGANSRFCEFLSSITKEL